MNLGLIVLSITALGCFSNFLNWRYLNYRATHLLYYVGAFVHETSHAILCVLTGAKIREFRVFSRQPHVTHERSRLLFVGEALISFAPIAGGLLFLSVVNAYVLGNFFVVPQFSGLGSLIVSILTLIGEINLSAWQSWVMIFLFFNVGAMIGPSVRDLKNIWLVIVVLLFINSAFLGNLALMAVSLVIINIILQIVVIAALGILRVIGRLL